MNRIIVISLLLMVSCSAADKINSIHIEEKNGCIEISFQEKTLLSYAIDLQYPPDSLPDYYKRSGFIHPLKTLAGNTITEGFPKGHVHQHGLFFAWTKTTFRDSTIDFWNQQAQLGIVRHKDILAIENSIEASSFSTSLEHLAFIEEDTIIAIDEQWDFVLKMREGYYVLDWTSTQKAHSSEEIIIEQYHYGGSAFRGTDLWNVKNNYDSICHFVTNEGVGEIDANHTRPEWASLYGSTEKGLAGIAIIQHPSNFRYPQFIRVHPQMPYFCFIPAVEFPFTISQSESYISKYRLVIFDGKIDVDIVDKEMQEYQET